MSFSTTLGRLAPSGVHNFLLYPNFPKKNICLDLPLRNWLAYPLAWKSTMGTAWRLGTPYY